MATTFIREELPEITERILASLGQCERTSNLGHTPLPSRDAIVAILDDLKDVLYPGYWRRQELNSDNVKYYVGHLVDGLHQKLTQQIARALRFDQSCTPIDGRGDFDVDDLATRKSIEFLDRLPAIRRLLDQDAQAAYEGDPSAKSHYEVVFCYPGLEAVTIYRVAHELFLMGIPLIPRMMGEHAHQRTGVDIHPGARIAAGFFIDHGTGVVIGETCDIGANVKLYQGVTLGALSFPRDAAGNIIRGMKRHPTLEDDVVVYANATILGGDTVVGKRAVIGSNVWLTHSVEANTAVMLDKPKLRIKGLHWEHVSFYEI